MLPTSLTGDANYVTNMAYDSAGRLLTRTLGNGLTQTFNYYTWNQQGGRLQTLVTGTLQNLTYMYDPVGNIAQITNSIAGETSLYEYDALDRLTSWQLNQDSPETYAYDSAGRLDQKGSLDLQYLDSNHVHAVTNANSSIYAYDANGNQTTRTYGSDHFDLVYDAENRLVEVQKNDGTIAEFSYDGDGQRVKSINNNETIYFIGGYYEKKGSEVTKYIVSGGARIAVRKYLVPNYNVLNYILGDHLGSTSVVTDASGNLVVETRYKPWGEVRFTTENLTLPTRYTFTGQYSYMSDEATDLGNAGFGLMYFNARWMDPQLGRFAQADSIIPGGAQGYDRYAYANNNPVRYNDPTGHMVDQGGGGGCTSDADCSTWLDTLTLAGIETVSPLSKKYERHPLVVFFATLFGNEHVSSGPAKIYPEEAEKLGIDPNTPEGAYIGMQARISSRLERCADCSDTDELIVAALGSDNNFSANAAHLAATYKDYALHSGPVTIDWERYLPEQSGNNFSKYVDLIRIFTSNVQKLQSQGYYVPSGVSFDYILNTLLPSMP